MPILSVQHLAKRYDLGLTHSRSIREAANRWVRTALRRQAPQSSDTQGQSSAEHWALRDVSFDVEAGESVGIIGRNGAGKSTLLKILSRITLPTRGRAELFGRVASLLEVGTGFHPELTGLENIYLNGAFLGMTKAEITARLDAIIDFAGIAKFLHTPVKRYSSGMTVRLGFAVAAHLDPEILIIDEVLAVGDAEFQQKCIGKMNEAARGGRTVLFVSHQIPAIRSVCRRVVVLKHGVVAFDGPVEDGVREYLQTGSEGVRAHASFQSDGAMRGVSASLLVNGDPSGVAQFGDELMLEVEFAATSPTRTPAVGFIIYDEQGTPVLNANNSYQRMEPLAEPAVAGTVRCRLGAVPLMPGRYSVSFWFGDSHGKGHVEEHALCFEVQPRDIWGNAKLPPRACSLLYWPTEFAAMAEPAHSHP